jgi:hypothetical protein
MSTSGGIGVNRGFGVKRGFCRLISLTLLMNMFKSELSDEKCANCWDIR